MSGSNSIPNCDWVRLNVGGKLFQTTKDTLSQYPESFLARMVNGDLQSEKDETGAFLIDRDPEHFRVILNYLRSPVLECNKNVLKELLREADFYNILPLANEIKKAMKSSVNRTELVVITAEYAPFHDFIADSVFGIVMSETQDDYEVLEALRQKLPVVTTNNGKLCVRKRTMRHWTIIEATLRSYGFIEEFGGQWDNKNGEFNKKNIWKFVRVING
ncbi:BTB/POZ domain-containing protein [Ditylenchus destructor]|uniref:BTB/POZ domain-containing protein n=1 Tax=Ditylenchus destructor TaxID=166010 RepID=A0AAD4QUX8_9BILA|nr:BTB/POZ domain-containing protein [Ditylenchus destructor]